MPIADIPNRPAPEDERDIGAILEDFDALIDVINHLDSTNIQDGSIRNADLQGGIAASKISLASGQLVVGYTDGAGRARNMTGDVKISNAGVTTLQTTATPNMDDFQNAQSANINLNNDGSTFINIPNCIKTLTAGEWMVTAKCMISEPTTPPFGFYARLVYGAAVVDSARFTMSGGAVSEFTHSLEAVVSSNESSLMALQAVGYQLSGNILCTQSWLHGVRLG